ncbi:MAG: hypothetical protein PHU44_12540 [Syntrophales bacterium]|nr:hypothetical protein [Syntrophales bacterium]
MSNQSLSRAAWPGTSGRDRTDPRSAQGGSRDYNPAGAKTPEDAQACIEWLYKNGRTDELVALLRRSSVYRVAWQCLQQSSFKTSGGTGEPASPLATSDGSELPAPLPGAGSGGRQLSPLQNLALKPRRATEESTSSAQTYPVLSSRPSNSLAAARRVYESVARYFSRGRSDLSRISVRV